MPITFERSFATAKITTVYIFTGAGFRHIWPWLMMLESLKLPRYNSNVTTISVSSPVKNESTLCRRAVMALPRPPRTFLQLRPLQPPQDYASFVKPLRLTEKIRPRRPPCNILVTKALCADDADVLD